MRLGLSEETYQDNLHRHFLVLHVILSIPLFAIVDRSIFLPTHDRSQNFLLMISKSRSKNDSGTQTLPILLSVQNR
jgi:hypothetical protein